MQVAQLPASHEKGGARPPRRAASSTVSPAWYGNRVLAALEPDHQLGGRRFAGIDSGSVVGDDESFDEHLVRCDADRCEAGFDRVHERPGPADVEVGMRRVAHEHRALRGIQEAAVAVEMVMHRQPLAELRTQLFEQRRGRSRSWRRGLRRRD